MLRPGQVTRLRARFALIRSKFYVSRRKDPFFYSNLRVKGDADAIKIKDIAQGALLGASYLSVYGKRVPIYVIYYM